MSPPVTTPLCLEFSHPRLVIRFRVSLPAGVLQPAEVLPSREPRPADPHAQSPTFGLQSNDEYGHPSGARASNVVSGCSEPVSRLSHHPALEPGAGEGWSTDVSTTVWEADPTVGWIPREDPPHQWRVAKTPTVGHSFPELRCGAEQDYHLGLVLPSAWAEERISMELHHFNLFNSGDPLNENFAAHLALRLGNILACPPLVRELSPRFPVVVDRNTVRLERCPIAVALRLDPFWRSYFLPESTPISIPDRVPLLVVESYRPHPSSQSDILLTTVPYPRRGQSVYATPFLLCCPLFGDNFLKPTWSLPMMALIEPRGPKFELVHQPTLKLENIEGLGAWSYYSLLDAHGMRIPCGLASRLWVELLNLF